MKLRKFVNLAIVAVGLTASAGAGAQEASTSAAHGEDFHVGLGALLNFGGATIIGSSLVSTAPFGGGSLVVPLDIGGVFRIEPELGYVHASESVGDDSQSATSVRAAVGAFFMFDPVPNVNGYVGARLGPQFANTNVTQDDGMGNTVEFSTSRTDFAIAPTLGAEYFFNKYFSLGAEAQLNFLVVGNESASFDPEPPDPPEDVEDSGLAATSNAALVMRVFFM